MNFFEKVFDNLLILIAPDRSAHFILVVSKSGNNYKIEAHARGEDRDFFTKINLTSKKELYFFVKKFKTK